MIRVLVVDDSATSRQLLRHILSADHELQVVGEAKNGAEAVKQTKSLHPNVELMDIHMPVLDGLQATREIMFDTPHGPRRRRWPARHPQQWRHHHRPRRSHQRRLWHAGSRFRRTPSGPSSPHRLRVRRDHRTLYSISKMSHLVGRSIDKHVDEF